MSPTKEMIENGAPSVNSGDVGKVIGGLIAIQEDLAEADRDCIGYACHYLEKYAATLGAMPSVEDVARRFALGDRVSKIKGSAWHGRIVGFYSTSLTPIGYNVESEREPGSVQLYPENALALFPTGEKS